MHANIVDRHKANNFECSEEVMKLWQITLYCYNTLFNLSYKKLVCEKQPVTLTNRFNLLTKICAHVSWQIFNVFF